MRSVVVKFVCLSLLHDNKLFLIFFSTIIINSSTLNLYLQLPKRTEEWKIEADKFEAKTGFPHIVGSMDGKHVDIIKPKHSGSYYFNYKKRFSIVLFAVVNADMDFMMVDVGTNGRVSDGGVLAQSKFFSKLSEGKLNLPAQEEWNGEELPFVFLGDDAFPLRTDLLKPYKQANLSHQQEMFNHQLSRNRVKVEQAFGILTTRFRILLTTIALCPEKVRKLVMATCKLHNYLRRSRGAVYTTPGNDEPLERLLPLERTMSRNSTNNAKDIRDKFCKAING